jgi:hypothetical protein
MEIIFRALPAQYYFVKILLPLKGVLKRAPLKGVLNRAPLKGVLKRAPLKRVLKRVPFTGIRFYVRLNNRYTDL